MIPRPPISTLTDTLLPYTTLFRSPGRFCIAGDQLGGGVFAVVFVYPRRLPDPASGAGTEKLVDETSRTGQFYRLRYLLAVGHGGFCLFGQGKWPDAFAGQAGALVHIGR